MLLQKIKLVLAQINSARTERDKLLHKLIFSSDESRGNRKKLRQFTGFHFKARDAEFDGKVTETAASFTLAKLISMANLLCLDIAGTEAEISKRINGALSDLKNF